MYISTMCCTDRACGLGAGLSRRLLVRDRVATVVILATAYLHQQVLRPVADPRVLAVWGGVLGRSLESPPRGLQA